MLHHLLDLKFNFIRQQLIYAMTNDGVAATCSSLDVTGSFSLGSWFRGGEPAEGQSVVLLVAIVRRSLVERAKMVGVYAEAADVRIEQTEIRETSPGPEGRTYGALIVTDISRSPSACLRL